MSASTWPAPPSTRRLVIVSGEEGSGKSTVVRALLPHTPRGARIDAEDVGKAAIPDIYPA
jgi:predicted ABC-type ATPase